MVTLRTVLASSYQLQAGQSPSALHKPIVDELNLSKGGSIRTVKFGLVPLKVKDARPLWVPVESEAIERVVDRYGHLIPAAMDKLLEADLAGNPEALKALRESDDIALVEALKGDPKILRTKKFGRAERLKAFYHLVALADRQAPVVAGQGWQYAGDVQIERMREILTAIENKATANISTVDDLPPHILKRHIEDPVFMKLYIGDRAVLRRKGDRIFDIAGNEHLLLDPKERQRLMSTDSRPAPLSYFSDPDDLVVVPSTRELLIGDSTGRVRVKRVSGDKPINYPYEHKSASDVEEALETGTTILDIPKEGTDISGKPLSSTYINDAWKIGRHDAS